VPHCLLITTPFLPFVQTTGAVLLEDSSRFSVGHAAGSHIIEVSIVSRGQLVPVVRVRSIGRSARVASNSLP
jgi:hypothetical protein